MASPQLENGFTEIAHEIVENLMRTHLTSNQWQVLMCIFRKTFGWHKTFDYISNSQIVEATGLCKAVVSRSLKTLDDMNLIKRKGKIIGFQKDWEQWQKLAESSTLGTKLAESSTLGTKLAESSTVENTEKLAISSTELAGSSTKVSRTANQQNIKDTLTKDNIVFPDWLNKEIWNAFLEMRKGIKKPVTPFAETLLIKRLTKLKEDGNDPTLVIERTIENSWQGLFPLNDTNTKGDNNGHKSNIKDW
jgi:phage replication O-like protein O